MIVRVANFLHLAFRALALELFILLSVSVMISVMATTQFPLGMSAAMIGELRFAAQSDGYVISSFSLLYICFGRCFVREGFATFGKTCFATSVVKCELTVAAYGDDVVSTDFRVRRYGIETERNLDVGCVAADKLRFVGSHALLLR